MLRIREYLSLTLRGSITRITGGSIASRHKNFSFFNSLLPKQSFDTPEKRSKQYSCGKAAILPRCEACDTPAAKPQYSRNAKHAILLRQSRNTPALRSMRYSCGKAAILPQCEASDTPAAKPQYSRVAKHAILLRQSRNTPAMRSERYSCGKAAILPRCEACDTPAAKPQYSRNAKRAILPGAPAPDTPALTRAGLPAHRSQPSSSIPATNLFKKIFVLLVT